MDETGNMGDRQRFKGRGIILSGRSNVQKFYEYSVRQKKYEVSGSNNFYNANLLRGDFSNLCVCLNTHTALLFRPTSMSRKWTYKALNFPSNRKEENIQFFPKYKKCMKYIKHVQMQMQQLLKSESIEYGYFTGIRLCSFKWPTYSTPHCETL